MEADVLKVSFVITVFNKAQYLPTVLEAIAHQTGDFDREFIIVNDGSTDGSIDIINAYASRLSKRGGVLIETQANSGPAIATNRGINLASGEVIKLVDGDDALFPGTTKRMLDALKRGKCRFVIGRKNLMLESKSYDTVQWQKITEKIESGATGAWTTVYNPLPEILKRCITNPSGLMAYKRDLVKSGLCAEHIFIQDYIILLGLGQFSPMGVVTDPTHVSPYGDLNRVSANDTQTLHDLNMALAEFLRRNPELSNRTKRQIITRATTRAWLYVRRNNIPVNICLTVFFSFLIARLGIGRITPKNIERSAEVFRHSKEKVRRPKINPAVS